MQMTAAATGARDEMVARMYSVTELAQELGITPRTLRFYEDKGLLKPQRVGGNRVYLSRDRARLILILRGKRLGFTIREISEYLDLYDADPTHRTQIDRLLHLVQDRIRLLEQQREALEETLDELHEIEQLALDAVGAPGSPAPPVHDPTEDKSKEDQSKGAVVHPLRRNDDA
jgi:DNA-binding transcriptional MerR regulator